LDHNHKRYLFGCCSVPTLDPAAVWAMHSSLVSQGKTHPELRIDALAASRPEAVAREQIEVAAEGLCLPPLMESYLRLGARVCSTPALDREFGVSDFLVLLDLEAMQPAVRRSFFARVAWTRGGTPGVGRERRPWVLL